MAGKKSELEKLRISYKPKLPEMLKKGIEHVDIKEEGATTAVADTDEIKKHFPNIFGKPLLHFKEGAGPDKHPLKVGVVLSGGQAPGGHNVIIGIFDYIREMHPDSQLLGFLGGPKGIFTNNVRELTKEIIDDFRNTGGFDMIYSGRDKIKTRDDLQACKEVASQLELDAIVVIGGDDSNTNAAVLAEYFVENGQDTKVIGVPKTIDGDMKSDIIEISFGFDTCTKVYSELIGNICRDASSARKYWHFVKLMGRSASHVTLECALQTHPNIALIGEEVDQKGKTLQQIVEYIAGVVKKRAEAGKNFGILLVPEGLIEFIPEIRKLIEELNAILAKHEEYFKTIDLFTDKQEFINQKLSSDSSHVFSTLPARIQRQLLLDRDSHGNVKVSQIETEKLLIEQVSELLAQWKAEGDYKGKFSTQSHFFGYEGRCSAPSNFDADYTYSLGATAAVLIAFGKTGYMAGVSNLTKTPDHWRAVGVPLTSLMNIEMRKGKPEPVIKKALVELDGKPFKTFDENREKWEIEEDYVFPGAIQYFGPPEAADACNLNILLERG